MRSPAERSSRAEDGRTDLATEREPDARARRSVGWLLLGAAFVAAGSGFVVAGLASLVSRVVWQVDSLVLPWGLVLAVGGSVALVVLARAIARSVALAAAAGWLVGLFYVFSPRSEGDYVIADDGLGYGFLIGSVLAVMIAAAWGSGP